MTPKRHFILLILSVAFGSFAQWYKHRTYLQEIESVSKIICDLVSTRAQGGSTRDVYDQIFSFLRSAAPDAKAQVNIKNGSRITGPASGAYGVYDSNSLIKTCAIAGLSDYEITTYYHLPAFLSRDLVKFTAYSFLILLLLFWLAFNFLRFLRVLWFDQFLSEINKQLGLIVTQKKISNASQSKFIFLIHKNLSKIFLPSVNYIKPAIDDLKAKLDKKHEELSVSQKLLEDYQEQTQRAAEFSEIVRLVKHDLKGPLSVLKFAASPKANVIESKEALQSSIASIEKIMSSLDKTNNLDAGSNELSYELLEVAIQECINEKTSAVQALQEIKFTFAFDESSLNPVVCKPNLLRRVISNLIQNAIEASSQGGVIELRTYRNSDGMATFEIKDQGSGIDLKIQEKLFQKNVTFGKASGSGLGLYFVKQNIDLWGGGISFKTSSQGTSFSIVFATTALTTKYRIDLSPKTCQKIAILDDEIEIHNLIWSDCGNGLQLFKSAHEFIEWLESDPCLDDYTLMIDLHLNDLINGVDVLRTIGQRPNMVLSTSDYFNVEALELAQTLKFSICPKPLLLNRARSSL